MVAFGTSELAERWPISKLELEIQVVCVFSALIASRSHPCPPSFLLFHRSIFLLLFDHRPIFLLLLFLVIFTLTLCILISSAISCVVGGEEPFS